jgi:hypothetical protein
MTAKFDVEVVIRMQVEAYSIEHLKDQMTKFCEQFPKEMRIIGRDDEQFCGERFNPYSVVMTWSMMGDGDPRRNLYTKEEILRAFDQGSDTYFYRDIRIALAKIDHEQWMQWSKTLAPTLEEASRLLRQSWSERIERRLVGGDLPESIKRRNEIHIAISERLARWADIWETPFDHLSRENIMKDLEWTDRSIAAISKVLVEREGSLPL